MWMKSTVLFIMLLWTLPSSASNYAQDVGIISKVYVSATGTVALQMRGGRAGIPQAVAKYPCVSSNGWVGHFQADSVLKSAILMAKSAGSNVTVTTQGCEGEWFKILDIYIN
ncbi:hypothetical protein [Zooshikella sp. RANM57]|uniref:hypothetical protein n=1 Tax=Zooshikella sp. RANM57 TaxID=3425863 RepID=UPI003D6F862A